MGSSLIRTCYRWFIHRAFALFYGEFAWTYDAVAWLVSRGRWQDWTLAALPYLRGRVLETGCGTGFVQQALARSHSGLAIGLDPSPFMLGHTRRRAGREGLKVQLVRAVAQRIPFPTGSFDRILATFPSDYLIAPETLAEIQRVLASSGQLVVVDAIGFLHHGWYERVIDWLYRIILGTTVISTDSPDGSETPSIPYQHMLEQAGFSCEPHVVQVGASLVAVLVFTPVRTSSSVAPE